VAHDHESESINQRIELLNDFKSALRQWFRPDSDDKTEQANRRTFINMNLAAVETAMREADVSVMVMVGPPPSVGGRARTVDMLQNVFGDFWGISLIPDLIDRIEIAVGVYEHAKQGDGLLPRRAREAIDIETAIERALRPAFGSREPEHEREVQTALEIILNAIGLAFTRDMEGVPVGAKVFKPDFVVPSIDLAMEVKLARGNHGAADIQEEINADISAYRTRWKRLMFIVYDIGCVKDPHRLRSENQKLFGVSVIVVKH
jgi:hypothetical protein